MATLKLNQVGPASPGQMRQSKGASALTVTKGRLNRGTAVIKMLWKREINVEVAEFGMNCTGQSVVKNNKVGCFSLLDLVQEQTNLVTA